MARGFGARESGFSRSAPRGFNYNQLDRELESIPANRQSDAARFYELEFQSAEQDRRAFETNLKAAREALVNTAFDWSDIDNVKYFVPFSKELSDKYDGDYEAFLKEKWNEYASKSDELADAEIKDREYEDDEGRSAKEAGLSEVDRVKSEFFKDLIGSLIDDRDKSRREWENETNAKTILDRFRNKYEQDSKGIRGFGASESISADTAKAEYARLSEGVKLHGGGDWGPGHEDPRVNPDSHEGSKYITMDDDRRYLLFHYDRNKDSKYFKEVLNMTKEDVRKVLADKDVRKVVMQNFARSNGSNLVTRDKFGNWFARDSYGSRNWVSTSDYSAIADSMLSNDKVAEEVLKLLKK